MMWQNRENRILQKIAKPAQTGSMSLLRRGKQWAVITLITLVLFQLYHEI